MALGLVVFPIDFLLKMVGAGGASGPGRRPTCGSRKRRSRPKALPTWLPRLVLLVLGAAGIVAIVDAAGDGAVDRAGAPLLVAGGAPRRCRPRAVVEHCWRVMWDLLRGAAQLKQPTASGTGRAATSRCSPTISGQPGFRELLISVHDIDAHRDLVFALLVENRRRRHLVRRPTSEAAESRKAEVFDLAGVARDYLPDALAAALSVPMATDWRSVTFAPDAYWRGETHRLCDRAGGLIRVVDELIDLGVEQIVLVSAAPESPGPHALAAPRLDGRARLGELAAIVGSRHPPRRHDHHRRCADVHDPAGAQPDRAVRFWRRVRRSIASPSGTRRADQPRLRRRLPSVHRAGGRRQRRAGRSSEVKS